MSRARLKINYELECEDMTDEQYHDLEIAAARFVENLEARMIGELERATKQQGLKIKFNGEDAEDLES